ncbi:MAG TPA: DoxX family membrane protein [Flavobacteriaceae bacterium]|nr:DoxX family membrane protein [Flavobacteriaceae bacterium]
MNSTFTKILRLLLALILIVIGLNKFLDFIPAPEIPENASEFMASLKAAGYVMPVIGIVEIGIGLLLILNRWVAFALLALVPISINVLLYHLFLDIPNIGIAFVVVAINIILIYKMWARYKPLFA